MIQMVNLVSRIQVDLVTIDSSPNYTHIRQAMKNFIDLSLLRQITTYWSQLPHFAENKSQLQFF